MDGLLCFPQLVAIGRPMDRLRSLSFTRFLLWLRRLTPARAGLRQGEREPGGAGNRGVVVRGQSRPTGLGGTEPRRKRLVSLAAVLAVGCTGPTPGPTPTRAAETTPEEAPLTAQILLERAKSLASGTEGEGSPASEPRARRLLGEPDSRGVEGDYYSLRARPGFVQGPPPCGSESVFGFTVSYRAGRVDRVDFQTFHLNCQLIDVPSSRVIDALFESAPTPPW